MAMPLIFGQTQADQGRTECLDGAGVQSQSMAQGDAMSAVLEKRQHGQRFPVLGR